VKPVLAAVALATPTLVAAFSIGFLFGLAVKPAEPPAAKPKPGWTVSADSDGMSVEFLPAVVFTEGCWDVQLALAQQLRLEPPRIYKKF
jgi:hypothetical protein